MPMFCSVTLTKEAVSKDTASVSEASVNSTVTESVSALAAPEACRHLVSLSDIHSVASHAVKPDLAALVEAEDPNPSPVSVSTAILPMPA
eukprot:2305220-Rhodomonas_salina.4